MLGGSFNTKGVRGSARREMRCKMREHWHFGSFLALIGYMYPHDCTAMKSVVPERDLVFQRLLYIRVYSPFLLALHGVRVQF